MKNIIIMGVGRAGKTTLSRLIKNNIPEYDIIHSDNIKWAIIRAQGNETEYRTHIQRQMEWEKSEFLQNVLVEFFIAAKKYGPIVLETGQLYLSYLLKHPKYDQIKNDTIIIVLGNGCKKTNEIVNMCKTYDTPESWSYGINDNILKDYAEDWEKQDKIRWNECNQYEIKYHNTTGNRDMILNTLCKKLIQEI